MALVPLPKAMHEHARARAASPAAARDAATIAVLRDGPNGLETFLMRRQATMTFGAVTVFPGGTVHDSDSGPIAWIGPSAQWFAQRFDCPVDTARALVVAAARETFEEVGVLLAGSDSDNVVGDTSGFVSARRALEAHELSFAEFLAGEGLQLRADLLHPWSHWITPAFEPKRFDTRFFVAALPAGQSIRHVNDESDRSGWSPVASALADVEAGEVAMLPPTASTCRQLLAHSAESALASADSRTIWPIEPRLVESEGELYLQTAEESTDD